MSVWRQPLVCFCAAALSLASAGRVVAVDYYVHPAQGSDDYAGTNSLAPFKTLARAGQLKLQPGDRVLLAAGQRFEGQLALANVSGSATNPIGISSYASDPAGAESRATIDAKGFNSGVFLQNCSQVIISDLAITANAGGVQSGQIIHNDMRCGVLVAADQPGEFSGLTLTNVTVRDVFFEEPGFVRNPEEVRTANGTQKYGWGIRFITSTPGAVFRDVTITDCQVENVGHTGLKLTAPSNGLQNVNVQRVRISRTGGPGVQMSGVRGGHFSELDVDRSGSKDDSRKWGRGSGLWTWGTSDVVIEKSRFQNAKGPGDSAGVHIDYHCRNVIVQYNLSANNAGGFCEILGNNYNCAYRYNISVNDGHRVKGRDGAFQEGKIFWLSGYTGDKQPRRGPFNSYFYNNTIYVREDIVTKFTVSPTTRGVLIANNIFHIKGRSESVLGDQNRPDTGEATAIPGALFRNNLFLRSDNWPSDSVLQDESPMVGDPEFQNGGGLKLEDYTPRNATLVRNRGIPIPRLPGDETGLTSGLEVERDILGNRIVGRPDLGAIELSTPTTNEADR